MKTEVNMLEGIPPAKKPKRVVKKKFFSLKNLPVEVAVRRQVAEEIGEAEPTRDQKFILLQKYGVTAPRIDRLVKKPKWMSEAVWKRKQNDWFKMTHGMARRYQQSRNPRPNQPLPQQHVQYQKPPSHRPWREIKHKQGPRRDTNKFRRNSGPGLTENRPN